MTKSKITDGINAVTYTILSLSAGLVMVIADTAGEPRWFSCSFGVAGIAFSSWALFLLARSRRRRIK